MARSTAEGILDEDDDDDAPAEADGDGDGDELPPPPPSLVRMKSSDRRAYLTRALDVFLEEVDTTVAAGVPVAQPFGDVLAERRDTFRAFILSRADVAACDDVLQAVQVRLSFSFVPALFCPKHTSVFEDGLLDCSPTSPRGGFRGSPPDVPFPVGRLRGRTFT